MTGNHVRGKLLRGFESLSLRQPRSAKVAEGRPDVDPGPAQHESPNPARPGREQRSGDPRVCRRQAGVHVGPARKLIPSTSHVLPRPRPQVPAPHLRRGGGAGDRHPHPPERPGLRPHRARLPAVRRPRGGEDHDRAHPRPRAQLREGGRADPRPLRGVRAVRRDRGRQLPRRPGDRRRHPQRRGAGPRAAGERALQPGPRPLQDLDHRRGPHVVDGSVQRAPEDPRRAAAAGEVHLRHHRVPQDPGHHPVAVPAVRLPDDPRAGPAGAPARGRRARRRSRSPTRRWPASPAPRRGALATRCRCSTRCSPSAARRSRTRTSRRCSASSTASCCSPRRGRWRTATPWACSTSSSGCPTTGPTTATSSAS